MYLFVFHPYMLPTGIGRLKFEDTYTEAMRFFDELKSIRGKEKPGFRCCGLNTKHLCGCVITKLKSVWKQYGKTDEYKVRDACNELRDRLNTKLNMTIVKEDKSKFVLFHGCLLASQLEELNDQEMKWEVIGMVWVELLAYAAAKCKANYHCQQLRRGGEFLTHVWLLMAHYGLTDHFQIPHAPSITELIVT
ncbi:hypothetical protein MLD38_007145 [Melastoma candidum]|uniref:Uncharacterized protein n=1 Tax=Melastoma candidum TaxID=119954 RepID=A0ACB9RPV6_9MYRT|nr:hypothetical protein MLD38_007145 [Melastoma candidum]